MTQGLGFNEMAGVKDIGDGITGRGVVNAGVDLAMYGGSFGEARVFERAS